MSWRVGSAAAGKCHQCRTVRTRRRSRMPGAPTSVDWRACFSRMSEMSTVPGGEAGGLEPAAAARLGLHRVDGRVVVGPAAGVGHVVGAAAAGRAGRHVDQLEAQRAVDGDGRVQRAGRLPGAEPHAADLDVGVVGGQQRHRVAVGRHDVALPVGADERAPGCVPPTSRRSGPCRLRWTPRRARSTARWRRAARSPRRRTPRCRCAGTGTR